MRSLRNIFLISLLTAVQPARAQDSLKPKVTFSAFMELYYRYDFNRPAAAFQPSYIYSYNRHNETNLNLAFGKVQLTDKNYRASLALGTGTYMNANYAAEPGLLKAIVEANAGVRLSRKKELWLDAGILPSHIGFESAIGKDCWALTRSLVADNSPYFETGVKLSYTSANTKWGFSLLALNGWQRIQRVEGNAMLSWGTQIQFRPTDKITLNYSNFIGTDKPDNARLIRLYHNLFAIFPVNKSLALTVGLDYGQEQVSGNRKQWNNWIAPVVLVQANLSPQWNLSARGEWYSDPRQVLISTAVPQGFRVSGTSLNLDRKLGSHILLRFEHRLLWSAYPVFFRNNNPVKQTQAFTTSMNISF